MIPFHSNRLMDYNKQKLFSGGYLFLQSIYYGLKLDSVCRKADINSSMILMLFYLI